MPIPAELRAALYNTAAWLELREELRAGRAGDRCECTGQCGKHHGAPGARCPHVHLAPAIEQAGRVVLGLAHWHQSESGLMVPADRLVVMCQGCHLRWDMDSHLAARAANRMRKMVQRYGQLDMFTQGASTQIH